MAAPYPDYVPGYQFVDSVIPMNMGTPTVRDFPGFNPEADCEAIRKATKGMGCDGGAVVDTLCHRSNAQRQTLKTVYQQMMGKNLKDLMISELKGNLEDLIVGLLDSPDEFDASCLRKAMEGFGTTESVLIDILCSSDNAKIARIKEAFKKMFGRDLEKDVKSETSGDLQRVLVSMLAGGRDESNQMDDDKALQQAQTLYKAGVGKLGTDEAAFNSILARASFPQLQRVFFHYDRLLKTKKSISEAINSEFSGNVRDAYLSIVMCAQNRQAYFAHVLYKSMKGAGTTDLRLIWAVISRCEIDMQDIKAEFHKAYGKSLESFIKGDTSGKYQKALLALVEGN